MSKRILIGIFLGVICFYFLFSLGVTILGYPETKGFNYILGWGASIFLFSTFTSGFVSAWFAKRKEILVSFISFFISYTPWVYLQFKKSGEAFWFYKRAKFNIIAPYIVLVLIAVLGGFVAKKIRERQRKESSNS